MYGREALQESNRTELPKDRPEANRRPECTVNLPDQAWCVTHGSRWRDGKAWCDSSLALYGDDERTEQSFDPWKPDPSIKPLTDDEIETLLRSAEDLGWYDNDNSSDDVIMRIHGDLFALAEEYRRLRTPCFDCGHDFRVGEGKCNRASDGTVQAQGEPKPLREFCQQILELVAEGHDANGGYLQELAVAHGLLKEVTKTEPCGEACLCAEVTDFPTTCYERTEIVK